MSLSNKFTVWISNWIDTLCGLISVITFTYYRPNWDFQFRRFIITRERNRCVEKENKKGDNIETDDV
jgi:hypothetical protein